MPLGAVGVRLGRFRAAPPVPIDAGSRANGISFLRRSSVLPPCHGGAVELELQVDDSESEHWHAPAPTESKVT